MALRHINVPVDSPLSVIKKTDNDESGPEEKALRAYYGYIYLESVREYHYAAKVFVGTRVDEKGVLQAHYRGQHRKVANRLVERDIYLRVRVSLMEARLYDYLDHTYGLHGNMLSKAQLGTLKNFIRAQVEASGLVIFRDMKKIENWIQQYVIEHQRKPDFCSKLRQIALTDCPFSPVFSQKFFDAPSAVVQSMANFLTVKEYFCLVVSSKAYFVGERDLPSRRSRTAAEAIFPKCSLTLPSHALSLRTAMASQDAPTQKGKLYPRYAASLWRIQRTRELLGVVTAEAALAPTIANAAASALQRKSVFSDKRKEKSPEDDKPIFRGTLGDFLKS